jgi:anthranilate 1,2-dioxygenase small subunit
MAPNLQQRVERFHFDYAAALNQRRYDDWPAFFVEEGCDYRIVSRENHDASLPAPLMGCYSHGMVKDRVSMLVKETLTYRDVNLRHFITNVRVTAGPGHSLQSDANFLVAQSDNEGNSSLYMVGRYDDELVDLGERLLLKRRLVVLDSFSIDTMLAVPL